MQLSKNSSGANSKLIDEKFEQGKSAMAHEFQNFVADIEDLVKATTNLTGDELSKAKANLQHRIAMAKDSAEDIGETIVHRARKTAESTNTYVHDQPWNAIGVSAAVGLLFGFLLARRS
jgi:ElaB/YqjD/DUF883 family membrane-anchored ribosome-binding protein